MALTRSCLKLYIPYYPDSRNYGWLGPICRFVSHSVDQAVKHAEDAALSAMWHAVTDNAVPAPGTVHTPDANKAEPALLRARELLPAQADFRDRKVSLDSFSSIGQRIRRLRDVHDRPVTFRLLDAGRHEDDEPAADPSLESLDPLSSDALPGGTRMGSMFHHIFENIRFQAVMDGPTDILADDDVRRLIASAMALYRIEGQWMPQIARMVAATLRFPIDLNGTSMALGRIAPNQRRHEMEFYFPLVAPLSTHIRVPGCTVSGGSCGEMVIRGFIDLVFFWQGRYYIADWKSNRLANGYDQTELSREMTSAGYALQYQLYTVAALRWLKRQLGDRFDPHHHFGGAVYIFIRGVGSEDQDGVFHVPPEQLLPVEALQETIQSQIVGLQW